MVATGARPAEPFAAAVLCGGSSRRMGRDKAFVAVDGEPMVRRIIRALRRAGADPVLTIGGDGAALASEGANGHLADRHPGEGPLGGVLMALDALDRIVVVVACDMPDLDAKAVRSLVDALRDDPTAAVATAEPLLAAWRPGLARHTVHDAFAEGRRAVHEAIALLPHVPVAVDPAVLRNVNRPDDIGSPP